MNKNQAVNYINKNYNLSLNLSNTFFSNINKSKNVWWFTIKVDNFNSDVYLILNSDDKIILILLPKKFVNNLSDFFKIRLDKNSVDIEISATEMNDFLVDIKSGGSKFNFIPFVKENIYL